MTYKNGQDSPNVASLDDARKRAAEKAKAEKRAGGLARGKNSVRDWIFAGLVIAMAIGYVADLVTGLGHK